MNMNSIVRAKVTNNQDPERLGRVMVRYDWLGEKGGNMESVWARVIRPTSQVNAGDWFLPDVGDEVIVGFEFGDQGHPIIIGGVWREDATPPPSGRTNDFNEDGSNNLRYLKTKAGHLLCFDDKEGEEAILLKDKFGSQLEMTEQKVTLKDPNGNQIEIDVENGSILVKDQNENQIKMGEEGLEVESGSALKITASDAVEIESSAEVKIESTSTVEIKGSAGVKIGAGAVEGLVKGESFMSLFNSHTHIAPMGPTSPPIVPMMPATHVSIKTKAE